MEHFFLKIAFFHIDAFFEIIQKNDLILFRKYILFLKESLNFLRFETLKNQKAFLKKGRQKIQKNLNSFLKEIENIYLK